MHKLKNKDGATSDEPYKKTQNSRTKLFSRGNRKN